jgi:hypothetical protein
MSWVYHTTVCHCAYIRTNVTTWSMTESLCPVFLVFLSLLIYFWIFLCRPTSHEPSFCGLWALQLDNPPLPVFAPLQRMITRSLATRTTKHSHFWAKLPQRFMYVVTCVHRTYTWLNPRAQGCRIISFFLFSITKSLIRINYLVSNFFIYCIPLWD